MAMRLIVGLGNPGTGYVRNRHNIGFVMVDAITRHHEFAAFKQQKKLHGLATEGTIGGHRVRALMPMTFMNDSGRAVGAAMRFWDLAPEEIVVLHDELDLAPGKVRAKLGGGVAGHNGLRSIAQHIGRDFWRVRIGIGHPGQKPLVHRYVLSDFAKADEDWIRPLIGALVDAAPLIVAGDAPGFMTRVALLAPPPGQDEPPETPEGKG